MSKQVYILGPCALHNRKMYMETADHLYELMKGKDWYYKTSFAKENRTSIHGAKGIGLEEGLAAFKEVKQKYPDIKLTTDIHLIEHVEKLSPIIDLVQIPAFLSKQTDLIVESAKHFKIVNIKKMQSLGPFNLVQSVDKVRATSDTCQVWLTERGTTLGYSHLVPDFTIVDEIKKYYDKYIFDVTHATQRSRKIFGTQGDPELAKRYFKAAKILGYDGVFAECHPRPEESPSDATCMILLSDMPELMRQKEELDKVK